MNSLQETYEKEVIPAMMEEFGITNKLDVPRIEKIVVNSGIGDASKNKELLTRVKKDVATITGQAPSVRNAKLSVASFSIREGVPVGLKVTLRRKKMYDFLTKLNAVVLPRLRDFRGVSPDSFDAHGNYNLGLADYSVFPEVDQTQGAGRGIEVTMVTSTKDVEKARKLLDLLGVPFAKEEEN